MRFSHPYLPERSREILRTIVQDYVQTAEPVGSQTVARQSRLGLSPATIRNVMADLEEMGLLIQPHTSAGRLPTERGLRYYIDLLLEREDLSWGEQVAIEKGLMEFPLDLSETLQRAIKLLAKVSGYAAVVSAPRLAGEHVRHIELVRLRDRLVLVICVLESGLVQDRLVQTDRDLPKALLDTLTRQLNGKLETLGFEEARRTILDDMEQDRRALDALWEEVFGCRARPEGRVYVEGHLNLLDEPEFSDVERIRTLLHAFEEKEALVALLDRCMETEGVQIFIGSEGLGVGVVGCGLVLAPYSSDGPLGCLGVVGPIRMNYARVMALVDYTAQVLSHKVKES